MRKRLLVLLIGALFLLEWGGCSDDNPEDSGVPDDTIPDSVAQYAVYGLDCGLSSCELLVINTSAETPLMSQELGAGYDAIYRTPDGRILLPNSSTDSTVVCQIDSVITQTSIAGSGVYHFDQTRGYHLRVTGSNVYRISTQSLEPLDSFAAALGNTAIDTVGRLLYGVSRTASVPATVYRYDYELGTLHDSIVMTDSLGQLIEVGPMLPLSAAGRLYFLGRRTNDERRAYVYDLTNHQIMTSTVHGSLPGRFVASSDGHTVYQSDPSESGGTCRIWYRDVASNTVRGAMIARVSRTAGDSVNVQVSEMRITPDNRYLYAVGSQSGYLLVIDLATHTLVSATSPFSLDVSRSIVLGDGLQ
jgi:hypothetical protein